jgi:hypothetical protein
LFHFGFGKFAEIGEPVLDVGEGASVFFKPMKTKRSQHTIEKRKTPEGLSQTNASPPRSTAHVTIGERIFEQFQLK